MSIEPEVRPELWPPKFRRRQGTLYMGALGVSDLVDNAGSRPVLVVDESALRGRALVWLTAMDEAFWPGYGMAGARVYCDPAVLGPELSAIAAEVGVELLPAGSAPVPLATTAVAAAARQALAGSDWQALANGAGNPDSAAAGALNTWGLHYQVPGVCLPLQSGESAPSEAEPRVDRQKDIADTLAAVVREAQSTAPHGASAALAQPAQPPAAPLVTVEISRALLQSSSILVSGGRVWSGLSVELLPNAEKAGRGVVVDGEDLRTVALPVNPTPYSTAE